MTGDQRQFHFRQLPFDRMQIRMTDAAASYLYENIFRPDRRNGHISHFERIFGRRPDGAEDHGLHRPAAPLPLAILPLIRAMRFSKSLSAAMDFPFDRASPSVATRMASP